MKVGNRFIKEIIIHSLLLLSAYQSGKLQPFSNFTVMFSSFKCTSAPLIKSSSTTIFQKKTHQTLHSAKAQTSKCYQKTFSRMDTILPRKQDFAS